MESNPASWESTPLSLRQVTPPSPVPPSPPRQNPQPRRTDARVAPRRPRCPTIKLFGTGRQSRVNINMVVGTSGPHITDVSRIADVECGATAEFDSSTEGQSRKRRRVEEGIAWSPMVYTVTLGSRPRDFIVRLASYCQEVNILQAIQEVTSAHRLSTNTGTLVSLTSQHALYGRNNNMTKFWQAVIEIQIALRCERFVLLLLEPS